MPLFWGENQYFLKKKKKKCVSEHVMFLKFIVFIYFIINLMLNYLTYTYLVVLTYRTSHFCFVLASESDLFLMQVYVKCSVILGFCVGMTSSAKNVTLSDVNKFKWRRTLFGKRTLATSYFQHLVNVSAIWQSVFGIDTDLSLCIIDLS